MAFYFTIICDFGWDEKLNEEKETERESKEHLICFIVYKVTLVLWKRDDTTSAHEFLTTSFILPERLGHHIYLGILLFFELSVDKSIINNAMEYFIMPFHFDTNFTWTGFGNLSILQAPAFALWNAVTVLHLSKKTAVLSTLIFHTEFLNQLTSTVQCKDWNCFWNFL